MNCKVWGYIRVSTKEQNEERQVNEILPLVSSISLLIIEKASGKDFKHPKFQALKELIDEGDVIIIKSLDRLGRNYEQINNDFLYLLNQYVCIYQIFNDYTS